MSIDLTLASQAAHDAPLYARFSRRLKGMFVDWVLMLVLIFGAMALASTLPVGHLPQVLGVIVVTIILLYEPLLVSLTGGTLGHRWTNLRVVDERHGGNVSFGKACARVVIKGVLGWYSFLSMAATRRNQAVHDLLTGSTVRIRDAEAASSWQYITERTELSAPDMPSRTRRISVIVAYLVVVFVGYIALLVGSAGIGALSTRCLDRDICSPGEHSIMLALVGLLLLAGAVCIVQGWRGRLFGARRSVA
jgi:uncharacterized RDD family membrane protein YckC